MVGFVLASSSVGFERFSDEKIHQGGHEAYHHHHQNVLQGCLQKPGIVDAKSQPDSEYRTQQRGDEHGADYHRDGIHVQPYRCDDNGKYQNPYVGASEVYAVPYVFLGGCRIYVFNQARYGTCLVFQILPERHFINRLRSQIY